MRKLSKREYNTIHVWNLRHFVKTSVCEHCKLQAKTQWSNKSGNYIKGDPMDWQELCPKCHFVYDNHILGYGISHEDRVKNGRKGGKAKVPKGFALMTPENRSIAGAKGGKVSRRSKVK